MEQTLDKVSYDRDRGNVLLNQIEERKSEAIAPAAKECNDGGGVVGPHYVSNQRLNGSDVRGVGVRNHNVSVKDVDMVIDGSQLYESESEIKRKKRSPYPMAL